MHRGNSILDMSTRSAQKKKRICLYFCFLLFNGLFNIFRGGGLSSQKSPFMFRHNDVQSIFGLRIFVKAHFRSTL